nr:transcriptional regulatory protein PtsJ [Klebsiella pneumoniae]
MAVDAEGMDPDGPEEALRNGARAVILTRARIILPAVA